LPLLHSLIADSTTELSPLSLHDALPISNQTALLVAPCTEVFDVQVADSEHGGSFREVGADFRPKLNPAVESGAKEREGRLRHVGDRKSTRLNSSHLGISYAVFCLKKKYL